MPPQQPHHTGRAVGPVERAQHAVFVGDDQRVADRRRQASELEMVGWLDGHGAPVDADPRRDDPSTLPILSRRFRTSPPQDAGAAEMITSAWASGYSSVIVRSI